jgi:hypothetical protein
MQAAWWHWAAPTPCSRKCGSVISAQAAGPQIAWIRAHEPQVWAATRWFFKAHNFIVHRRLTGKYILDHQSASQCVPLYDLRDQSWDPAPTGCPRRSTVSPVRSVPTCRLRWPGAELVVYGALSTHRQTGPDKLSIPIFVRSLIYETKTVRGYCPS